MLGCRGRWAGHYVRKESTPIDSPPKGNGDNGAVSLAPNQKWFQGLGVYTGLSEGQKPRCDIPVTHTAQPNPPVVGGLPHRGEKPFTQSHA